MTGDGTRNERLVARDLAQVEECSLGMHKAKGPNPVTTLNRVCLCVPVIIAFPRRQLENQKFKVICG